MESTLGKRISANRKRLKLTQDQLAEKLGVTAQAVSKWENDQSCPDISTLPLLADIFGISVDALLGREAEVVHECEVVAEDTPEGAHFTGKHFDLEFEPIRFCKRPTFGFAVLVLLVGALLLVSVLFHWEAGFWDILWPSSLLVFGLFGLYPKFHFFHLGCALFGGYFLLDNLNVLPFTPDGKILLPVVLLLFGISLLIDACKKPPKFAFSPVRRGKKSVHQTCDCTIDGETFHFSSSFGENAPRIVMPRLSSGTIDVSFGDYSVDLSDVAELAPDCVINAKSSFGELRILVPTRYKAVVNASTAFASVDVDGQPDAAVAGTVRINADSQFGQIRVRYI